MTYETQGQVEFIGQAQTYGTKGFTKREFTLLITEGEYTNSIKFEFTGDKCERLDQVKVGDQVTVKFALTGRTLEFTPKLKSYTNLRAFYISSGQNSQPQSQYGGDDLPPQGEPTHAPITPQSDYTADGSDDIEIPF